MSIQQLRNVNFGRNRANATGSLGVGYTILDETGAITSARTTAGVYQIASGTGIYATYATFPDNFRGQIYWDTGTAFVTASFAVEQYNVEENNPLVDAIHTKVTQMSGTIGQLYDQSYGRWKIENDQMKFYKEDNVTLVATFDLFDDTGTPTMDAVFERRKV